MCASQLLRGKGVRVLSLLTFLVHFPLGAFQDQSKQTVINKYSNNNHVKNLSWRNADQLIYSIEKWKLFKASHSSVEQLHVYDDPMIKTFFFLSSRAFLKLTSNSCRTHDSCSVPVRELKSTFRLK